jgi:hypothetical protein
MRDGLKPGSRGKRKQRRYDNRCGMQRAIRVALKIAAPRQVLSLGRRSAGLQVVCQRNNRKQNYDQYGQCHNLHTGACAQRCIRPSALAPKPKTKEGDRDSKPQQVEERFQDNQIVPD